MVGGGGAPIVPDTATTSGPAWRSLTVDGELGDGRGPVVGDLGYGERQSREISAQEPGEVTAGHLRAAFDEMSCDQCSGELVPGVPGPTVPPCGRADRQRSIGHPAADHDAGPAAQGPCDPPPAQVGVRRCGDEPVVGEAQIDHPVGHVIAADRRDVETVARLARHGSDRRGQTRWIETTGVDHDAGLTGGELVENWPQMCQEGPGEARLGVARPQLGQDAHGDLGEVVAGQHVRCGAAEHIAQSLGAIAVETGEVGDSNRPPHHTPYVYT